MAVAADLLQSLVPISQFNKGQASKIFDRLRSEKELIVLKNGFNFILHLCLVSFFEKLKHL